jgi:thymidylate kinase
MELQRLVAEGYEAVASRNPRRLRVIDASGDPDSVHAAVMAEVGGVRA